jgi:hypothetical protein
MQQYADLHKKSEKRAEIGTKAINSLKKEEFELDEAKADMYHKHMLKALGKTRLPKDHGYTSAIANNGDFVVRDSSSVVARIPKGEHNIKEEVEELSEISRDLARSYIKKAAASKWTGEPVKKDRDSGITLAGKKAYPGLVGKAKIDAKEDKDQE